MTVRERLSAVRCFLLDLDGTLYLGDRLIDGALSFLQALQDTGRQCLFLTNNSSRSAQYYRDKLERLGVPPAFRNILTSGQAAARYVKQRYPGKRAFLMANAIETAEIREMGVLLDQARPDYVLLAYDTELTYEKLTQLCNFVRAGLPYIATHPDFNCPVENGFVPDIGAVIAYVKASTGREPDTIIGKPNAAMIEEAERMLGMPRTAMAMVGDRLYTDIAAGVRSGMLSILVLSGETTRAMADASSIQPDLVFDRLSDMIASL